MVRPRDRTRRRVDCSTAGVTDFDITEAMRRIRVAVKPYPKAAMFELRDDGFASVFEQLVSCMISIRTLEEVTLACSRRLFEHARTPAQIAMMSEAEIDGLIRPCTFHPAKAKQIRAIARGAVERFAGELPPDMASLTAFHGVGPKCASLAIGVSTGTPVAIPVDIHVHRVTNRWGLVQTATPEKTASVLETALPRRYWLEINERLVPFGRNICRAPRPKCPHCPLRAMCPKVGVEKVDPTPPKPPA